MNYFRLRKEIEKENLGNKLKKRFQIKNKPRKKRPSKSR